MFKFVKISDGISENWYCKLDENSTVKDIDTVHKSVIRNLTSSRSPLPLGRG